LLRLSGTTDVVDAAVAVVALASLTATILTSDPGDLRLLIMHDSAHPRVQIVAV
jgi:hypothetical protein